MRRDALHHIPTPCVQARLSRGSPQRPVSHAVITARVMPRTGYSEPIDWTTVDARARRVDHAAFGSICCAAAALVRQPLQGQP
jgi:hypothetical protein